MKFNQCMVHFLMRKANLFLIAIGEEMSSYDFLDAAMEAEERALRKRIVPDDSDDFNSEITL